MLWRTGRSSGSFNAVGVLNSPLPHLRRSLTGTRENTPHKTKPAFTSVVRVQARLLCPLFHRPLVSCCRDSRLEAAPAAVHNFSYAPLSQRTFEKQLVPLSPSPLLPPPTCSALSLSSPFLFASRDESRRVARLVPPTACRIARLRARLRSLSLFPFFFALLASLPCPAPTQVGRDAVA